MSAKVANRKQTTQKPAPKSSAQDDALRRLLANDNAASVGALLRVAGTSTADALVPRGSLLDSVTCAIKQETDCPPELGVISTLAVTAAALCSSGSHYVYHDDTTTKINPALWNVALAESGAGKTFVRDVVAESLDIDLPSIPTPASGPAFIDSMTVVEGVGYWDKDEYGQQMKQISTDSTLITLKDFMLHCHDHKKITNSTRTHGLIEVERPVLSIYGSTPNDSLAKCLSLEMLVDGFAARHLWAATDCPDLDVFRYNRRRIRKLISDHPAIRDLRKLLATTRQFTITESAEAVLQHRFRETVTDLRGSLRRGFVRRITWAAGHYAMLYHVLTQKSPGDRIGVYAARWAWRMVMYHLQSARTVLSLVDPGVTSKIQRMTLWLDQQRSAGNLADIERRFYQRFSRDLSSMDEARKMMQVCGATK